MSKQKQATLDDLTALADGGLTANQIANRLNKAELAAPAGKRWYDSSVIWQMRQQYGDAELKKVYPAVHADCLKYDKKQAAKKASAKAKAAAVNAVTQPSGVVVPKRSPELQTALKASKTLGEHADTDDVADDDCALVVVKGESAAVTVYTDQGAAVRHLLDLNGDSYATVVPVAEVPTVIARHGVVRITR